MFDDLPMVIFVWHSDVCNDSRNPGLHCYRPLRQGVLAGRFGFRAHVAARHAFFQGCLWKNMEKTTTQRESMYWTNKKRDIWLLVWTIFYFPIYWEESSQLTFIFFRGVGSTTNQICWTDVMNSACKGPPSKVVISSDSCVANCIGYKVVDLGTGWYPIVS